MTHTDNPSGSDLLPIPSNTEFHTPDRTIPSNTNFHTRDIASAYTYGDLNEIPTIITNNNNNIEIIRENHNEYYQLQASQNSSSNSNLPEQYSTDSVITHNNNHIK
jgi:hypothetical protein